jgi:hypothetical protein
VEVVRAREAVESVVVVGVVVVVRRVRVAAEAVPCAAVGRMVAIAAGLVMVVCLETSSSRDGRERLRGLVVLLVRRKLVDVMDPLNDDYCSCSTGGTKVWLRSWLRFYPMSTMAGKRGSRGQANRGYGRKKDR